MPIPGSSQGAHSQRSAQCPTIDALCHVVNQGASPTTQWVLEHVKTCDECRQVLGASVADAHETDGDRFTLAVGETVATRYKIIRRLGLGGMGEVYEALDGELDEHVALKTLSITRLDSGPAINRFKQEIKLARRVTHACVCKLFEFGFHNRQSRFGTEVVPFITMELIPGRPLNEATQHNATIPLRESKSLLLQLIEGLAALHDAGVVHRDLKPHNILLVPEADGRTRVVLIDFGLARIMNARPGTFSGANVFAGSFEYASPEQLRGETITPQSDLYSLGILAFEMLTGHRPFAGSDSLAEATQRLTEPPRSLQHFNVHSPQWQAFISKCLARSPHDRFSSSRAAASALSRLPITIDRNRARRRLTVLALASLALVGGGAAAARAMKAPVASVPRTQRIAQPASMLPQASPAPATPTQLERVRDNEGSAPSRPRPLAVQRPGPKRTLPSHKASSANQSGTSRPEAASVRGPRPSEPTISYRAWQSPEPPERQAKDQLVSPYASQR